MTNKTIELIERIDKATTNRIALTQEDEVLMLDCKAKIEQLEGTVTNRDAKIKQLEAQIRANDARHEAELRIKLARLDDVEGLSKIYLQGRETMNPKNYGEGNYSYQKDVHEAGVKAIQQYVRGE